MPTPREGEPEQPPGFLDLDAPSPAAPDWDRSEALELLLWCSSAPASAALTQMLSSFASGLPGVFTALELAPMPSPLSGSFLAGWVLAPSQEPFLAGLAAALERADPGPLRAWLRLQRPVGHPDALGGDSASFWVLGPGGFTHESVLEL